MRVRYEQFGAIIAVEDPPALAWVDPDFVRSLGLPDSERWNQPDTGLSAPTEVHMMVTNRCPAGCPGCYTGATLDAVDEPTDDWKRSLDDLAKMGVFHVAMGGGESILREDLFDLADYARTIGMTPNLTTSGIGMTAALAQRCSVFGQINVSLDGVGAVFAASRGYDGAGRAIRALELLADAGCETGVNFVLSRLTFDHLEETMRTVARSGGNEVEVLRFKPTGRGIDVYEQYRLTPEQIDGLLDHLLKLADLVPEVTLKIDCSLVPFLCAGEPDVETLERFGIFGCEAGNALSAITHKLDAIPCSFLPDAPLSTAEFARDWDTNAQLRSYRDYHTNAPEPCASCTYRTTCKGGCRAVSKHLLGEPFAPDPECPRVIAHSSSRTSAESNSSATAESRDLTPPTTR